MSFSSFGYFPDHFDSYNDRDENEAPSKPIVHKHPLMDDEDEDFGDKNIGAPTSEMDAFLQKAAAVGSASSFLQEVSKETVDEMAKDAAVSINTMQGVPEDVKLSAIESVERKDMQKALGPAFSEAVVAGIVQAMANPEVQKALGVQMTPQARALASSPAVQQLSRPLPSQQRQAQADPLAETSAQQLEEALDPEADYEVDFLPQPRGNPRVAQGVQVLRESALAASTMSNAMVGTSNAAAQLASSYKDLGGVSGITGIRRSDVEDAKKAGKRVYSDLSKQGSSAKKSINKNTTAAYDALKKKKAAAVQSQAAKNAKARASAAKASAATKASSARSSASRRASSARSSISGRAGKLGGAIRRKASSATSRMSSGSEYNIAMRVLRGEALELALEQSRQGKDAPIGAFVDVEQRMGDTGVDTVPKEVVESLRLIETANIQTVDSGFSDVDRMVESSLRDGYAQVLRTEDMNASVPENKQQNPVKNGMLEGFKSLMGRYLGKDGIIMDTFGNLQGGIVEKGGVIMQKIQYGVKKYWTKFLTEWLPVLKDRLGEYTDTFLRETLPELMRELPNMLVTSVGTLSDLIQTVLNVVGVVGDLIGADMGSSQNLRARILHTFTDDGLDAVISGEAPSFEGKFVSMHATDYNADTIKRIRKLRDKILKHAFDESEENLVERVREGASEMQVGGLFDNLFKKKEEEKKEEKPEENKRPFGDVGYGNLLEFCRAVNRGENGYGNSDEALRGYSEELASALTLHLTKQTPAVRKEMTRTLIIFFVETVNKIGDLNSAYGTRPFEGLVSGWLSSVFSRIGDFQVQRERVKQAAEAAANARERAQLEARLAELKPEADLMAGGKFGDLLKGLKSMVGLGKKTKEDEFSAEAAKTQEAISKAQADAIAKLDASANSPARRVENTLARASMDLLAMAYEDATTVDAKVWDYMHQFLQTAVGGDFQGRDRNEINLLNIIIKFFSATILYFMNAEGKWTDINLSLMVQYVNEPMYSEEVAKAVHKLRRLAAPNNVRTSENSFEIKKRRAELESAEQMPYSIADVLHVNGLIHKKRNEIPAGARLFVVGGTNAHNVIYRVPNNQFAYDLNGTPYTMTRNVLGSVSTTPTPLIDWKKKSIALKPVHEKVLSASGFPISFCTEESK